MANQEQLTLLLNQGAEAWNQWRREHQEVEVDLSGADLTGANLVRTSLDFATLTGATFNGTTLDGSSFFRAHLERTHFDGAHLDRADLVDPTDFTEATITGASFVGA